MHNVHILVGAVDGDVVAPYCVVAVNIVVAEFDRSSMCSHDVPSENLVECRNGTM